MKQGIAVFFLLLVLMNQLGNPVLVTVRTVQIAVKMRSELRLAVEARMVTLALSTSEFQRSLYGRDELLVNGRLFDIASLASSDNIVIAKGVFDDEETGLLNMLKDIYRKLANDDTLNLTFGALIFIPSPGLTLPETGQEPPAQTLFLPYVTVIAYDLITPPPRGPLVV